MPASDIPGYVQGFRFNSDAANYDSVNGIFYDKAGYGERNALEITVGTPSFVTVTEEEGLTLDNTCQGLFYPAIPWEGSMILIAKPTIVGGTTHTILVILFGSATSATSNGGLWLGHASGNRNFILTTGGSVNAGTLTKTTDQMRSCGFAKSQETRKGYFTHDGVTISETTAVADNNHGGGLALGSHAGTTPNKPRSRFGNLSGVDGDAVAFSTGSSLVMFEMHFFKGNIWVDHLPEAAAFMAELRTQYGVT